MSSDKRRKLQEAARQQPRRNGRFAEKPHSRQPAAAAAHHVELEEQQSAPAEKAALYKKIVELGGTRIVPGDKAGNIKRLQGFSRDIREQVISVLIEDGTIRGIPDNDREPMTAESLLEVVEQHPNGFSISGRQSEGDLVVPLKGFCVTAHGTDYLIENSIRESGSALYNPKAVAEVADVLTSMEPLLGSGHVWIGGFKWENGEKAGKYEINITLVFPPDKKDDADTAARIGDQRSYWEVDHSLPEEGTEHICGGDGGRSEYQPGWRQDPR